MLVHEEQQVVVGADVNECRAKEHVAGNVERPPRDLRDPPQRLRLALVVRQTRQVGDGQFDPRLRRHLLHRVAVDEHDPRSQDLVPGDDRVERLLQHAGVEGARDSRAGEGRCTPGHPA